MGTSWKGFLLEEFLRLAFRLMNKHETLLTVMFYSSPFDYVKNYHWIFVKSETLSIKWIQMRSVLKSLFVAIVSESPGDDVRVAADELIRAHVWIDKLRSWNDGLPSVCREAIIAVFLESAPSTCRCFCLLFGPNSRGVHSKRLMGRSWIPGAWACDCSWTFIESGFSWWIQIPRFRWPVSGVVVACRASSEIWRWAIRIPVLAQNTAWFDSAWACSVAGRARVTWQLQSGLKIIVSVSWASLGRSVRIVVFRWKVVQSLLDISSSARSFVVRGASVRENKYKEMFRKQESLEAYLLIEDVSKRGGGGASKRRLSEVVLLRSRSRSSS